MRRIGRSCCGDGGGGGCWIDLDRLRLWLSSRSSTS